jgi:hypothetical protein
MLRTFLLSTGFLALLGCSPTEEEEQAIVFSSEPLAGVVNGEPWRFVGGATNAFLSDEDGFFTSFHGAAPDAGANVCDQGAIDGPELLTKLPPTTGEFEFSFGRSLTFSYVDDNGDIQNDVAISEGVRIDEIDEAAGTISGALKASTNGHEVDGTFTVTICPDA